MGSVIELQRSALKYLDQRHFLQFIKETCSFYATAQDRAFQFVIPIDPDHLVEIDASLGNLLLNQPTTAAKVFQEVIYMSIRTLDLLPKCTHLSQVVASFRLTSLPPLPDYQLKSASSFIQYAKSRRFLQYEGIVCGMSTIHKYTKVARFVCSDVNCEGAEGDKYIRLHIPGAREAQTIRSDFKCSICNGNLEEDVSCRVLSDKITVELVDEEAFSPDQSVKRHQSIVTYLRDDLVHGIEIGQKLSVVGTPVLDVSQGLLWLEVNSLLQTERNEDIIERSLSDKSLPLCIRKLHYDRNYSPWSFGLSLAYAFAGHIVPAGTYLHLKLGLLLSLVASVDKEESKQDLLAVGSDILILQRLLIYAASFSTRCVLHTSSSPLTAAVTKDRYGSDTAVIDGGTMLLANGGVCVIPHLGTCKKQVKDSLFQALEKNKILVEVPPRLANHGSSRQLFLPRRCSVWATFDPSNLRRQHQLEDIQQINLNSRDITQALADVFGMVYFVETPVECYAELTITHQILLEAMGIDPVHLIQEEDFKQFVTYVRAMKTKLTEESEHLIKGYYVASRTVRATGLHMWTLPIDAIKVVTGLAEAHAKLCLRVEVTEHDAIMAILLYEECVTTRSGQSILGVKPLPHIKDNNLEQYIGQERDEQLYQFGQHVKNFIHNHAPDVETSVYTEE